MKFVKKIILFLFIPLCGYAQNGVYFIPSDHYADSVRQLLKTNINDTLKMSAYYEMAAYYTELNKDTSASRTGDGIHYSITNYLNIIP